MKKQTQAEKSVRICERHLCRMIIANKRKTNQTNKKQPIKDKTKQKSVKCVCHSAIREITGYYAARKSYSPLEWRKNPNSVLSRHLYFLH